MAVAVGPTLLTRMLAHAARAMLRSRMRLPAALELCTSLRDQVQDGTPFSRRVPASVSVHFLLHPVDPLEEEFRVWSRPHGPVGHRHVDGARRRKRVEIEHWRTRAVGVRADDVPAALIHVDGNVRLSLPAIASEWNRRHDHTVPHDLEVIDRDVRLQPDPGLQPVPPCGQPQLVTNLGRK